MRVTLRIPKATVTRSTLASAIGSDSAAQELFDAYRPQLRRMIAVRMDSRLSTRLDPSDVVQEILTDAFQQLPAYVLGRPLPFYPWLRRLAWQRLIRLNLRMVQP